MRNQIRTVIYGAGSAGLAAASCLSRDRTQSVVAFADSDRRKIGTSIGALPVVGPTALSGSWFDHVVVASQAWREITSMLMLQGISRDRLSIYQWGEDRVTPYVQGDASLPNVLVLTDDCVSPGHGIGAVLLKHLAKYPANRLSHVYLRRKGDPFWPSSHALAIDGCGEQGSRPADAIVAGLKANGQLPDVIYSNVFGEPGLEALRELVNAFAACEAPASRLRVPVIQHFHDVLPVEQQAFERALRNITPLVSEFWAITDALGEHIGRIAGRDVMTVNTFKCQIAKVHKKEHRDLSSDFRVVMLGNSHMPWVMHHVRNVWRRIQTALPDLGPIQWYAYPTSVLYVRDAGVEIAPEIEYYGFLNDRVLHEHLCGADLAIVPFNVADEPEYQYAAHSVPSRITEFLNAGLPIMAAAGRGTETFRFLTGRGIGVCATIADEARFATALRDLMEDTSRRRALGWQGRSFAEQHCDLGRHQEMLTSAFVRVSDWQEWRQTA